MENLIEDLPLRKLLTMQQTDTTNGTQNIIEDVTLDIDVIMLLKIKKNKIIEINFS